jgi:lipoyl(octanoyl) transferase
MPCIAALPSIFNRYVSESKDCIAVWHGRVQYAQALDLQMRICDLKKRGFDRDMLLLLEHPPTITLGRNASMEHLLAREEELKSRGVVVCNVDRGGDITFHGPGQLVGYPLLSLNPGERDVHRYMRNLEESLIDLLKYYGIPTGRDARFTGVWTDKGKIAAMGVHISRWITRHGFALNVNTDLSFYNMIVPCGIVGRDVTSMQKELSRRIDLAEVAERYIASFGSVFHRNMILMSPDAFLEDLLHAEASDVQERIVG